MANEQNCQGRYKKQTRAIQLDLRVQLIFSVPPVQIVYQSPVQEKTLVFLTDFQNRIMSNFAKPKSLFYQLIADKFEDKLLDQDDIISNPKPVPDYTEAEDDSTQRQRLFLEYLEGSGMKMSMIRAFASMYELEEKPDDLERYFAQLWGYGQTTRKVVLDAQSEIDDLLKERDVWAAKVKERKKILMLLAEKKNVVLEERKAKRKKRVLDKLEAKWSEIRQKIKETKEPCEPPPLPYQEGKLQKPKIPGVVRVSYDHLAIGRCYDEIEKDLFGDEIVQAVYEDGETVGEGRTTATSARCE